MRCCLANNKEINEICAKNIQPEFYFNNRLFALRADDFFLTKICSKENHNRKLIEIKRNKIHPEHKQINK